MHHLEKRMPVKGGAVGACLPRACTRACDVLLLRPGQRLGFAPSLGIGDVQQRLWRRARR